MGSDIPRFPPGTASTHILGILTSGVATPGSSLAPPLRFPRRIPPHIFRSVPALSAKPHIPSLPVLDPVCNPDAPKSRAPLRAKVALSKFCTQPPPLLVTQKLSSLAVGKRTFFPAGISVSENLCSVAPPNLRSPFS